MLRPRNQVRIFYEDTEDTTVISRARNEGARAAVEDAVTTGYAENLLSYRYGEEVKVYIEVGGSGKGKPLLWQPAKETSLEELAKFTKIRFTYNKVEALFDF